MLAIVPQLVARGRFHNYPGVFFHALLCRLRPLSRSATRSQRSRARSLTRPLGRSIPSALFRKLPQTLACPSLARAARSDTRSATRSHLVAHPSAVCLLARYWLSQLLANLLFGHSLSLLIVAPVQLSVDSERAGKVWHFFGKGHEV